MRRAFSGPIRRSSDLRRGHIVRHPRAKVRCRPARLRADCRSCRQATEGRFAPDGAIARVRRRRRTRIGMPLLADHAVGRKPARCSSQRTNARGRTCRSTSVCHACWQAAISRSRHFRSTAVSSMRPRRLRHFSAASVRSLRSASMRRREAALRTGHAAGHAARSLVRLDRLGTGGATVLIAAFAEHDEIEIATEAECRRMLPDAELLPTRRDAAGRSRSRRRSAAAPGVSEATGDAEITVAEHDVAHTARRGRATG